MLKDKARAVVDYIIKHYKIVFPVIVVAAVAVTVTVALNANAKNRLDQEEQSIETTETVEPEEIPMTLNEDQAIADLIDTYYRGVTNGDTDLLNSVCDEISLQDMLGYQERSKYIDHYPVFEIYTKPGLEAGSTIAFVYYRVVFVDHEEEFPGYSAHYICTDDQGGLYIKRSDVNEEQDVYLGQIMSQDDVVEFNNRVTVEYNELMSEHPELLEYLSEMDSQVNAAVGVDLADQNVGASPESGAEDGGEGQPAEGDAEAGQGAGEQSSDTAPAEGDAETAQYVTATTTVNVRSSDSENADRLGKVTGGTRLQMLEQKVNGWTKVLFEGKEGYIKTEYLETVESADGMESIGTVTATTNINVRASASETAEKLGVMAGGDSADLLANENGWCKIRYNGQVGYVKADYVQ